MDGLLCILNGDAKRLRHLIRSSGIFYVAALKLLKRDYGNPIIVSHLHVKSFFKFSPLKSFIELSPKIKNNHYMAKINRL